MQTIVTIKVQDVYSFDELSDQAKETARKAFRECALDDEWWDHIYEEAAHIADILGIDLRTRQINVMGGGIRFEPNIWFSGFSSQGDGACFEGSYSYKKGALKELKSEFPQDNDLHDIARRLTAIQKKYFFSLKATVNHRGHYYHSNCTDIECDYDYYVFEKFGLERYEPLDEDYEELKQVLRNFMDWIYKQLELQYDYLLSDECIDESIEANE